MKKINLMPALLSLLVTCRIAAQPAAFLDTNNIRSGYISGAVLSMSSDSGSGVYNSYEVPKGSGIKSIFASAFWISGLDSSDSLHLAATQYNNSIGLTYGPVAANYNAVYDSNYKKVFKVTQNEIAYHLAHYGTSGYVPPADIAQWPGNGNTTNGEAARLAPFADMNGNGIYEPLLGEYPEICGDQAVFMMMNDDRPGVNNCRPMQVELHVMAYANAGPAPISNTTFLHITVFNRSSSNYHGVYFSHWVDNDLGCANNDRVGCDTVSNYFYVYNGIVPTVSPVQYDGGAVCPLGELGYGYQKVAQATVFLNRKMNSFCYSINGARPGMRDPGTCAEYRNWQTGFWTDGTPFTYGGNGYGNTISTSYMFTGDPTDTTQWSELNPQNVVAIPAGDRRGEATIYLDTLAARQSTSLDLAYVTSFADSLSPYLHELTQLRQDVQAIGQLFNHDSICTRGTIFAGLSPAPAQQAKLRVYPNPATGSLTVEASEKLAGVQLFDLQGRELMSKERIDATKVLLDISPLSRGAYLIATTAVSGLTSLNKVIVE